jgi:hypothetical protein
MSILGDFQQKIDTIISKGKPEHLLKAQIYFMIELSYERILDLESDLSDIKTKRIVEKMMKHFESLIELVQAYSMDI